MGIFINQRLKIQILLWKMSFYPIIIKYINHIFIMLWGLQFLKLISLFCLNFTCTKVSIIDSRHTNLIFGLLNRSLVSILLSNHIRCMHVTILFSILYYIYYLCIYYFRLYFLFMHYNSRDRILGWEMKCKIISVQNINSYYWISRSIAFL